MRLTGRLESLVEADVGDRVVPLVRVVEVAGIVLPETQQVVVRILAVVWPAAVAVLPAILTH